MPLKTPHLVPALLFAGLTLVAWAQTPPAAPASPAPLVRIPDASAAMPKVGNVAFFEKHAANLKRAQAGPVGLLFLGDSITEGWRGAPEIWQERYGAHEPANFGISGDHTNHVIWRVENGELDRIKPRVVVLMIGTNNSGIHTGAEIAAANTKLIRLIREKLPETKVLLLAIFPRGPRQDSRGMVDDHVRRMAAIRDANVALAKLDDGTNIRFLDINASFLASDGSIPNEIMPDQLHLSPAGYKAWAVAMQPLLAEMLK